MWILMKIKEEIIKLIILTPVTSLTSLTVTELSDWSLAVDWRNVIARRRSPSEAGTENRSQLWGYWEWITENTFNKSF